MLFYMAPMEELTGYVYRSVYAQNYPAFDKYFTPFLTPVQKKILKTRDRKEVAPENNTDVYTVPQVMTNDVEGALLLLHYLIQLGYEEINWNLGCPSATVVSKGKGAGMLKEPEELDRFFHILFDRIYKEGLDGRIKLSVKSRLGMEEAYEWEDILAVYNRYPFQELILHPRFRKEYYQGQVHLELFQRTLESSLHPVCYNGDIFSLEAYISLRQRFPELDRVMIGRGIIGNPRLLGELRVWEQTKNLRKAEEAKLSARALEAYHARLFERYCLAYGNETDAMFKCKEVWFYLASQQGRLKDRKYLNIKKARNPQEYKTAVQAYWAAASGR